MFLSGALDDTPKDVIPVPPTPKLEGPAWGGTKILKGPKSLRDIQDEQSKIKEDTTTRGKDHLVDLSDDKSGAKLKLSSFLPSVAIPMVSPVTFQSSDGERGTPPWAASGTPPLISRPSLRDIQSQQVRLFKSLLHSTH